MTYMIKDAARELNVEAHVLRYWEEELGLAIKRNSMGHRYYDEKDILIFKNVQELKKRGLSLKDIRDGIDKARSEQTKESSALKSGEVSGEVKEEFVPLSETLNQSDNEENNGKITEKNNLKYFGEKDLKITDKKDLKTIDKIEADNIKDKKTDELKIVDFKLAQLQSVMNRVVANALRENKDIITSSIKEEITADVMKQFDTVMREKEEREEKRYKKLDEYLRELQRSNLEAAAARERGFFKRKKVKKLL
ncbi:MAG: MerR family transcriptional regulator [Lachnospiraceae bacterium]|nr:MerR family transcriptional regulator [Lachnospiraceae bacterium]